MTTDNNHEVTDENEKSDQISPDVEMPEPDWADDDIDDTDTRIDEEIEMEVEDD